MRGRVVVVVRVVHLILSAGSLFGGDLFAGNPQIAPNVQSITNADRAKCFRKRLNAITTWQDRKTAAQMQPAIFLLNVGHDAKWIRGSMQREVPVKLVLWQAATTAFIELCDRLDLHRRRGMRFRVENRRTMHIGVHFPPRRGIGRSRQADKAPRFVRVRIKRLHVEDEFSASIGLI